MDDSVAGTAAVDWGFVFRLGLFALAAASVGVLGQARAMEVVRPGAAPPGLAGLVVGTLVLTAVAVGAAAIGSALAPRVGIPAFSLSRQALGAGVVGGVIAAAALPLFYVLMPRASPALFRLGEELRMSMGLPARVAIGGIIEEIVFRWGVLALIAWGAARLAGGVGTGVRSASIVGAAVLFGAAHLPGAAGLGVGLTLGVVAVGLLVNGWLGIVCGYLVWNYGLAAAITAHATVHVLWSVAERMVQP